MFETRRTGADAPEDEPNAIKHLPLNTFIGRFVLPGRFERRHSRARIGRIDDRFGRSHTLSTLVPTPQKWVRSTSTSYPSPDPTFQHLADRLDGVGDDHIDMV